MAYVEPRTHPLKPSINRHQVDEDVLRLAEDIQLLMRNEELWHRLMEFKRSVIASATELEA